MSTDNKQSSSEMERTIDIFVRLTEMQVKLLSIETKISELASFVGRLQETEMRVQGIENKIEKFESCLKDQNAINQEVVLIKKTVSDLSDSKKSTDKKVWSVFLALLPHIITLSVVGLMVRFGK